MKWFKHDSDASLDAKLKRVRMKYGMEGYGVYWYCLEMISQNVTKHNLTFELEHDAELISLDTNIHQERIQEMMMDFVKWRLFENSNGVITCLKMSARTDEYTQKLIKSSGVVGSESGECPDKLPIMSDLKEKKRTEEKRFIAPSGEEVQKYLDEKGITHFTGEQFVNFYGASNWLRGKTKIKSWKHCVGTWRKDDKKDSTFGEGAL